MSVVKKMKVVVYILKLFFEPKVSELHKYLDWIHIMTYDLHGGWEWKTGHHTAMKTSVSWDTLSVPNAVDYWMTNFGKGNGKD